MILLYSKGQPSGAHSFLSQGTFLSIVSQTGGPKVLRFAHQLRKLYTRNVYSFPGRRPQAMKVDRLAVKQAQTTQPSKGLLEKNNTWL